VSLNVPLGSQEPSSKGNPITKLLRPLLVYIRMVVVPYSRTHCYHDSADIQYVQIFMKYSNTVFDFSKLRPFCRSEWCNGSRPLLVLVLAPIRLPSPPLKLDFITKCQGAMSCARQDQSRPDLR
jgi:hypothetical protein